MFGVTAWEADVNSCSELLKVEETYVVAVVFLLFVADAYSFVSGIDVFVVVVFILLQFFTFFTDVFSMRRL